MAQQAKRYMISFECTREEQRLIEQRAKQEGLTRSDYIRTAVMMDMVMSGDVEALKFVGKSLSRKMGEIVRDRLSDFMRSDAAA